jgi:hypothetical protein
VHRKVRYVQRDVIPVSYPRFPSCQHSTSAKRLMSMSATGAYFIRGGFSLLIGLMLLHAGWTRVSDINLNTYINTATNVKLSIVECPASPRRWMPGRRGSPESSHLHIDRATQAPSPRPETLPPCDSQARGRATRLGPTQLSDRTHARVRHLPRPIAAASMRCFDRCSLTTALAFQSQLGEQKYLVMVHWLRAAGNR